MDIFSDHVDPERDQPRERSIPGPNDNAFKIKCTDPYSFWTVHRERGQVPESLQGMYTSYERAALAVEVYARTLKETPSVAVSPDLRPIPTRRVVSPMPGGIPASDTNDARAGNRNANNVASVAKN